MEQRRLLLKMNCKKARSCCGGRKDRTRYSIVDIEREDAGDWQLIGYTTSTTNIMRLTKKHKNNLWRGSVYGMGLHDNEDFMKQLIDAELVSDGCQVIE